MPSQQQRVLFHQPIDTLGVDGIAAGGSPLALEDRGDPPVSVARPSDRDQGMRAADDPQAASPNCEVAWECVLDQILKCIIKRYCHAFFI